MMLSIFHIPASHLYVLFRKKFIQFLCLFFNQVIYFFLLLTCEDSLFIFNINSLPDIWLANIFSHYIDRLFILLIVSILVQNFLAWCSTICLCLLLLPVLLCHIQKIISKTKCQRAFPVCFLLGVLWFQVLCLSL